ncbi:hypothetical protein [Streptomyces termitum]|uniref:hypothetical protein n=1 Tax=Streptomyces termitum TaxID=67368 RepID=UPI0037B76997
MRVKHASLGTAAVLASLMTGFALPQAHAETSVSPLATSPGISPSAPYIYAKGGLLSCPYEALCTSTWDPTANSWKIYVLRDCVDYNLSYWNGKGAYINNQSGGARARFFTLNGSWTASADNKGTPIDWNPIWKIRPC